MTIALGCYPHWLAAKRELLPQLQALDYRIEDFGCDSATGIDFPEIAYPLALAVASQQCDLGIVIGSIGMGMTMVTNKVHGIRAATVQDEFTAHAC
jgi:ribose 5-phosphate isomerase B